MKVPFLDKRIRRLFYSVLSAISVFASFVVIFVDIGMELKTTVGIVTFAVLLVALYICVWFYANTRQTICIKINTSEVEVKFGDIFSEKADLKAIAFNEYFDTSVDDNGKIIAKTTLNGQFIEKFYKDKITELDTLISSDVHLTEMRVGENTSRKLGKKMRHKLGTICLVNDYLLIAFSRFDDNNKAYLEMNDYINCLLNLWNEVDRVYAGRTLALPVLGSGITRFRGYENITDQELLELIIWTFKVSRIKFTYPSKLKIVVFHDKSKQINLLALKDLEA